MATIDYFGECCVKFEQMPIKGEILIEQMVRPENRKHFEDVVKLFIDFDYGRKHGFYLEFSNDYTKVRKLQY